MTTELKQAAQQAVDAFDAFGDADDFASLFELTQKMRALRAAIQQAEVTDEREAFEAEMRCEDVWGHRSLKKRPDGRYQNWQVDLMWDVWQARSILSLRPEKVPMTCHCHTCRPITMGDMRMVLCPKCGNKRCPHANDHRNDCTGSNEPGQPGSAYPAPHGITAKAKKE